MQRLIQEHIGTFQGTVNQHLAKGWRIVPGTIGAKSLRKVPELHERRTAKKESFEHISWCVVERDDQESA